jgi:hypothetical protein
MSNPLDALARELGASCERHAELELEGARLEATLRPRGECPRP